jgi:hypothetical protein
MEHFFAIVCTDGHATPSSLAASQMASRTIFSPNG